MKLFKKIKDKVETFLLTTGLNTEQQLSASWQAGLNMGDKFRGKVKKKLSKDEHCPECGNKYTHSNRWCYVCDKFT